MKLVEAATVRIYESWLEGKHRHAESASITTSSSMIVYFFCAVLLCRFYFNSVHRHITEILPGHHGGYVETKAIPSLRRYGQK
jgi:glycopeptide antibiotics resistance protein